MPVNVSRLRWWFAAGAVSLVVVVAGFYIAGKLRAVRELRGLPDKLGVEIQQSTEGFSLSKSEGGRTLFTVRASKAISYKKGGKAELHDVDIVVYGRKENRADRIYGKHFEYDPQTSTALARGEVQIDLEAPADATKPADPGAQGGSPAILLKTAGLAFNHKTGQASTSQVIEFRIPQASGTAEGAAYDANQKVLTLEKNVNVTMTGDDPAHIIAGHGVILAEQRKAVFDRVRVEQKSRNIEAERVEVFLRDDNTVERVIASGSVSAEGTGASQASIRAPRAEFTMNASNRLRSAVLTGGVEAYTRGEQPVEASAQRMSFDFGANSTLRTIRAMENVRIRQAQASRGSSQQPVELAADVVNFKVSNGRTLTAAETEGRAQVAFLPQQDGPQKGATTIITADRFVASFAAQGTLSRIVGAPNARIVSSGAGQPDRTSTSREVIASFDRKGQLASILQEGNFEYREKTLNGERVAYAARASYAPQSETFTLSGAPRVAAEGLTVTANSIRYGQKSGELEATGNVKTSYSNLKPNASGGMLASGDPVHVTAQRVTADNMARTARYSGKARLWQGANIVQAPAIIFDHSKRSAIAEGDARNPVSTVFVQPDAKGKLVPVTIKGRRLVYEGSGNTVRFEGGVTIRAADVTTTAGVVTAYLANASREAGPSQIERIVAEKGVVVEDALRRAKGEKLVYTAPEGKFVLSGGPPEVIDRERGRLTGASLTFWRGNDRVLVEGGDSRAVITTRVSK